MIGKLKIDYDANMKKGDKFRIAEIKGKRITLIELKSGKLVDFGFSEVEIIAPNKNELFSLGQFLSLNFGNDAILTNGGLKKCIEKAKENKIPVSKTIAGKALDAYIFNNY